MLLIFLLGLVVLVNSIYYVFFSTFLFHRGRKRSESAQFPVSVLICAKNEMQNLSKHIPLWLAQDYPNFELILINDASSDNTLEIMNHFADSDPRIKVVDVENNEAFWGSKKYALTLGIKKASNKRMLFTDADCRPASGSWITHMASNFSEEKQIILGYGAYDKKPGLLNALIRFETLITALQYFSYAYNGIPYMGVGRNLAYTSNLFYANKGFTAHMNVRSGDDDLFVNQAATSTNTSLQYHPDSFTYSIPKKSWGSWIKQKKRHSSTAKFYKPKHKFLLGTYYVFNLLFWIIAISALLFYNWKITLPILLSRFLIQYVVCAKAARKFNELGLVVFIPLLELFLVCVQLFIFISSRKSKQHPWK
ncbi:MAG: glycosyltransferase [Bacteroidia bacterium]|nr:glycosyltransferase [Bacteroidia bacterium]NNF30382.1 glycosyltransferase [Flavobacteriaceae bacterium]MBT8276458.1 glycosyltransferase [Bacteroidia bacterium]NNJ80714.1 glycosyltransferase [Flavobacteriaceae bacterium]NNK53473.1 glycosyltransferase [Flavobacteriaceae bacterium]